MKRKLYEIAILVRKDDDRELLIPPTPVMANDEEAAKFIAILMTKDMPNVNVNDLDVKVRLFQ